jgi:hypothetical protein
MAYLSVTVESKANGKTAQGYRVATVEDAELVYCTSTQIGDDEKQRSACLTAPDKEAASMSSMWHLARAHAREIAVVVARPPSPMTHEIRSRKLSKPWRCTTGTLEQVLTLLFSIATIGLRITVAIAKHLL